MAWLVAVWGWGQAAPDPGATNPPQGSTTTSAVAAPLVAGVAGERPLVKGTRLTFRILEDEEEVKSLVVTDAGEVEIPYVGRMKAAGKTCSQLAEEAGKRLEADYYHRATVVLSVDTLGPSLNVVYVTGQVRSPMPQEVPEDGSLTVGKAILRAGGFVSGANRRRVKLIRNDPQIPGKTWTVLLDMVDILEKGKLEADPRVQANDIIYVPDSPL